MFTLSPRVEKNDFICFVLTSPNGEELLLDFDSTNRLIKKYNLQNKIKIGKDTFYEIKENPIISGIGIIKREYLDGWICEPKYVGIIKNILNLHPNTSLSEIIQASYLDPFRWELFLAKNRKIK